MREISSNIWKYFKEANKTVLVLTTLCICFLTGYNYYYGIDKIITKENSFWIKLSYRYFILLAAFGVAWVLFFIKYPEKLKKQFFYLVLFSPLIFAFKMAYQPEWNISASQYWNNYWNHIVYWPFFLFFITVVLYIIWKILGDTEPFYGIKINRINWKPYWLMLFMMVPVIGIASTQPDFLSYYPKMKLIQSLNLNGEALWWQKLLFELSYGSDFFTIELFFRGFLVLALAKWAGKDAILPMACFYCAIHFGKPLGECISSYFGGIILGVVVYHSRSIYGGLFVHLGIAWMMELGGYLGNLFFK